MRSILMPNTGLKKLAQDQKKGKKARHLIKANIVESFVILHAFKGTMNYRSIKVLK